MELLAMRDLPQPEGIAVWCSPPHIDSADGGLTVDVAAAFGTAGRKGRGLLRCALVPVPVDFAHDLSRQAVAFIWPGGGDRWGTSVWDITVVAFVDAEALEAFDVVLDAFAAGRIGRR